MTATCPTNLAFARWSGNLPDDLAICQTIWHFARRACRAARWRFQLESVLSEWARWVALRNLAAHTTRPIVWSDPAMNIPVCTCWSLTFHKHCGILNKNMLPVPVKSSKPHLTRAESPQRAPLLVSPRKERRKKCSCHAQIEAVAWRAKEYLLGFWIKDLLSIGSPIWQMPDRRNWIWHFARWSGTLPDDLALCQMVWQGCKTNLANARPLFSTDRECKIGKFGNIKAEGNCKMIKILCRFGPVVFGDWGHNKFEHLMGVVGVVFLVVPGIWLKLQGHY